MYGMQGKGNVRVVDPRIFRESQAQVIGGSIGIKSQILCNIVVIARILHHLLLTNSFLLSFQNGSTPDLWNPESVLVTKLGALSVALLC